ncbi:MAG: class I SAM-dependent methyltransferase [Tepidanaerobacteraceae bacterium]|nr:class I SAM-dependent methyltransferase [Tepidanaerobacteraceae bacterium]
MSKDGFDFKELGLVCLNCLTALEETGSSLLCQKCGQKYPVLQGIPSFTDINPLFEGRFVGHIRPSRFSNKWFFPVFEYFNIASQRVIFLKRSLKQLPRGSKILDVGCGGGGYGFILKGFGQVVGTDVSLKSLEYAKAVYPVVHASITALPFPSGYFDAVVSSDVLGHIPLEQKAKAFSEMHRVLKKGGLMVHSAIETDSDSVWFRFAKKYPALFQRYHIDKHGHIGLEMPSVILDRCREFSFDILNVGKINAMILRPEVIIGWFDNEYREKNKGIAALVEISKWIDRFKISRIGFSLLLGVTEKLVNPFIDVNKTTGLLLCCQKRK